MNNVVLLGNLVRDVELKHLSSGTAVGNLTLAVNRRFKKSNGDQGQETTYIDCEIWDKAAETVAQYIHQGDPLLIQGSLKSDNWETDDGQKRSKIKVRINEFKFVGRKKNESTTDSSSTTATTPSSDPATGEDDIPF